MLGVFFALIMAASFGFNNASARRGALSGTAFQGLCTSMVAGTVLFGACLLIFGDMRQLLLFDGWSILWLCGAGFSHFVWGRYWNIRSLAAVGSNLAGPIQQFQLLLGLTLAIIFLGESLSPLKVVGIILVVAAPTYIIQRRAADRKREKAALAAAKAVGADVATETKEVPKFNPRMVEGYTCALLAGVGFGSSSVLAAAGLKATGASFAGGFISYIFATAIVGLMLISSQNRAEVRAMQGESRKWFMISGLAVSVSQMFRYLALTSAPVTVVQPIHSLSLMFRMIFGYFMNREHEAFDRYVLVGLAMSLLGALALSVSDDTVIRHLPLPDWLLELSKWKWPAR
jgi:drug/metabolite transporter (DMT)-like permease